MDLADSAEGSDSRGAIVAQLDEIRTELAELKRSLTTPSVDMGDPDIAMVSAHVESETGVAPMPTPPLPSPGAIEATIAARQARTAVFGEGLFADPAWDMILDLVRAEVSGERVSVSSLCLASGVPSTTALRWINLLVESGVFERVDDTIDRRRSYVTLTQAYRRKFARYWSETEGSGVRLA